MAPRHSSIIFDLKEKKVMPQIINTQSVMKALDKQAIINFILSLDLSFSPDAPEHLEIVMMSHIKMSALYWAVCSLAILGEPIPSVDKIIEFVQSCANADGGYGGDTTLDSHILFTLSAVQVMTILGREDLLDSRNITRYVLSLQANNGCFMGDEFGEQDTRFVYCGILTLRLLGTIDDHLGAVNKAVAYIHRCCNPDTGYGSVPGAESHAGQIFCCVSTLVICGRTEIIHRDGLVEWLALRQQPSGGLNGRPQKVEDVCYSWWVVSSLRSINALDCIDKEGLRGFILESQDVNGGIADRPGDVADLFHTFFGLAGLALLGEGSLQPIDPVLCIPHRVSSKE